MDIKKINKFYNMIFLNVGLIIFFLAFLFFVNKKTVSRKEIAKYEFGGDINYKVDYKKDIPLNSSDSNYYVANSIENMNFYLDCFFNINNLTDIDYRYEVIASVISNLDNSKVNDSEVFRNDKNLFSSEYKPLLVNDISITDTFDIDYNYFNNIASIYNNSVDVAVKSKFYLFLNLYIKDAFGKEKKMQKSISFNLEESTFTIQRNNIVSSDVIYDDLNSSSYKTYINIAILSILVILFIFLICIIYKFSVYRKKNYAVFKYRKIMQDYDNYIVPIRKLPDYKQVVGINVLNFKSMVNIQKELHLPILYFNSGEYIVYIIMNDKIAYTYFLDSNVEKL